LTSYDLIGTIASLLSTLLFLRLDIKAWAVGLVASFFNSWLYWQKGIYTDMCLESFYFISICYGWYMWSRYQNLNDNDNTAIKKLTINQWGYLSLVIAALFCVIFILLTPFSHSSVIKYEALTASLCIVAQWLMCRKVIATWIIWILADLIYAAMYLHKGLPVHTLVMLIYTGMAIIGYFEWLKVQPKTISQSPRVM